MNRPPNPPSEDRCYYRGEIFSPKFGNLPPCELEGGGVMGCDIIIGGSAKRESV